MVDLSYAGIGSRKLNRKGPEALDMIESAYTLAQLGFIFNSGDAIGSDTVFELGHLAAVADGFSSMKHMQVFVTREKTKPYHILMDKACAQDQIYLEAVELVSEIHPLWEYLDTDSRLLHVRNAFQVLGRDLRTPVNLVACYTEDGIETRYPTKETGGTGTALKIAQMYDIPIFNFKNRDAKHRLEDFVSTLFP